jgi:RNA polymerase sigma-70 factor (sigma-E family)
MTTTAIDFDGFYLAHYGETVAMAYGYTADLTESQDIAQEAFSRAWQRWKVISHYEQPVSWVRRVATHLAHSRWRRLKVASAYLMRQRTEDLPELSPDHVDLVAALRTLPTTQRKAIVLHYLADLPVAQIAEELGVSDGTVKSWLHRGRNALAAELGDEVRRTVSPPPAEELRLKGDKRRHARRATVSVVAAFVAVVLLVTGAQLLSRAAGPPIPPAFPTPSAVDATPTVSPTPAFRVPAKLAPAAPATCSVQQLPYPNSDDVASYFSGGDPTGHFLIGSSAEINIYVWRDGKLDNRVVVKEGLDDTKLYDINSSGVGVGGAYTENGDIPYLYRDGKLSVLPGRGAAPVAINENNVIIGYSNKKPAIWRTPTSMPELLNVPPDFDRVQLSDISDEGLIVGVATKSRGGGNTSTASFLWYPDGTYIQLPHPPGIEPSIGGAFHVRGEWAAGNLNAGNTMSAVRWNLRTGTVEVLPGMESLDSLNVHGWVGYRTHDKMAVRTQTGQDIVLPAVKGADKDFWISTVGLVSDDGRTFGGEMQVVKGRFTEMVAVRWVCQ